MQAGVGPGDALGVRRHEGEGDGGCARLLAQYREAALVGVEHGQALDAAVMHDGELGRGDLGDGGDQDARQRLQRLQLVGGVLGDLDAGAGAALVGGVQADDVVGGDLHDDDEAPAAGVGPLLAHVEGHEHAAAVGGDGVVGIGVVRAVEELVEHEVAHVALGAAAVARAIAQARAVHDQHVVGGRDPDAPGGDPAVGADGGQREVALQADAAAEGPRRRGGAVGGPQSGHGVVEGFLAALGAVERPAIDDGLVALAARQLGGGALAGGVEVPVLDEEGVLGGGAGEGLGGRGGRGERDGQRERGRADARSPMPNDDPRRPSTLNVIPLVPYALASLAPGSGLNLAGTLTELRFSGGGAMRSI